MIRDGLSLNEKIIRRNAKDVETDYYKEDLLISVINLCEFYSETYDVTPAQYIKDPYGILLMLKPFGYQIDNFYKQSADIPTVTCKEYCEAIESSQTDLLTLRMTEVEKFWCNAFANGFHFNPTDVITAICKGNRIDIKQTLDCWRLQPNTEAMAFALGSPRALMEGVTPVIGIPLNLVVATDAVGKIRYPGIASKYRGKGELIQIHKDGEIFVAYDMDGVEIDLSTINVSPLEDQMSFVITGFLHHDELVVNDILCWNDIWLYRRPLAERIKMLWRFPEYTEENVIVRSPAELTDLLHERGRLTFRNLNRAYDPTLRDAIIRVATDVQTCTLSVRGRRGGRGLSYLTTSDNRAVFEIPARIEKEDRGDLIEVKRDGTVVRIVEDGSPDSWAEVGVKWGFDLDYNLYSRYKRLPKCTWFE